MGNRTGTYVAFDGQGETNPTHSDFRYYSTLQAWKKNKDIDFSFANSHEKTYSVKDSSQQETLKQRINERLSMSKQMVVIISKDTRKSGSMLSYEIERAVDHYKLPLIVVYPDYKSILHVDSHKDEWPKALKERIESGKAKAIHIPFCLAPIKDAVSRFSVNGESLTSPRDLYSLETYRYWGLK